MKIKPGIILIAMAGRSDRFFQAGYTLPKYELKVADQSLFSLSVKSFAHFFGSHHFVFVTRKEFQPDSFVTKECRKLGIKSFRIHELQVDTLGQAESVFEGIKTISADQQSLTIFNIDTIKKNFSFPSNLSEIDGYLEVFQGEGSNWSFAECLPNTKRVVRTAEKRQISNFCSDGLYYFSTIRSFTKAFNQAVAESESFLKEWKEFYVAPLYNYMIREGAIIQINLVPRSDIIFSGTPDEYLDLVKSWKP